MTRSRAVELADRQRHQGDRAACAICAPRPDRIRHDHLWCWSLAHPGERPLR